MGEEMKALERPVFTNAGPGALMYRRTDVRDAIHKLNRRYAKAMHAAQSEMNEDWRFNAVQKLRLLNELKSILDDICPVFTNTAQPLTTPPAEVRQKGQP